MRWDASGSPELVEQTVIQTGTDSYFIPSASFSERYQIVRPGVDFFLTRQEGLKVLLERIKDAIKGHRMAITSLQVKMSVVKLDLEELEEDGRQPE